ncbi:hypothetical protein EMCG_00823 [[Emmonsia] crescens]|uniref:C2H2-type domain-containing protein n=1 Tax=[Emmonsia] crescens TaxID=73230 RepID=A0A0G2J6F4_9EURO|nr:hypothetical protein EMCG_00823 [Emmonsia crescens UAMH 3008]
MRAKRKSLLAPFDVAGPAIEDIKYEDPIFDLATECERLFATHISTLNDHNEPNSAKYLGDLSHRFATWAAFLGVFAESRVCLDRRLQHHPAIQDQVLRLLAIMERNLIYVFERDDGSPDRVQIEPSGAPQSQSQPQSVRISINCHPTVVSDQPGSNNRGFAETFDLTSFSQLAYLSVGTLYPDASRSLVELITRSMTETYSLFLHRKSHQERLPVPRSRSRTPILLAAIKEEETATTDVASPIEFELQVPEPSRDLTYKMIQRLPTKPIGLLPQSEASSVDSQEFRAKLEKLSSSPIKRKTTPILANHADYSRPVKGSLTCGWCFSPITADTLEGANWQQHVNKDHKPYICISEKCSKSLLRFSTSTQWFGHMLTHGQKWHREVYKPLSWACPLCADEDTRFSKSDDLTAHLKNFHNGTFTEPQAQAIILADQSPINSLLGEGEVMASHVAEHLQSVMLLTLRLISIDVTIEVSADSQSTAGASGTAHHLSWVSPSTGNSEQGIDNIDGDNDPDDDPPWEDIVPDSEYTDWHHVPHRHGVNTLGKQCSLREE